MKKLFIGSDHAGFQTKALLIKELFGKLEIIDCGTYCEDRTDYTQFAHKVAQNIQNHENSTGILICGSAIGVSMVANRYEGVRGAVIYNEKIAELCRQHNNANVACFGARFFSANQVLQMVKVFLQQEFAKGVHLQRVKNIENSRKPSLFRKIFKKNYN